MDSLTTNQLALFLTDHLDTVWTFLLLLTRMGAAILLTPGIGMGQSGLTVRFPAIICFAVVATSVSPTAALPGDFIALFVMLLSEVLLGAAIGFIPYLIISGVLLGGYLASTSMGIGVNQLIDPTTGNQVPDYGRLLSDLTVVVFLFLNGHHVIIYALSGLGETIVPGTFVIGASSLSTFTERSADIFRIGLMVSAPILVALLLTQFVMALVSRAVPQVNVFVVSFPFTIGIGLIIGVFAVPDFVVFAQTTLASIEDGVLAIVADTQRL